LADPAAGGSISVVHPFGAEHNIRA